MTSCQLWFGGFLPLQVFTNTVTASQGAWLISSDVCVWFSSAYACLAKSSSSAGIRSMWIRQSFAFVGGKRRDVEEGGRNAEYKADEIQEIFLGKPARITWNASSLHRMNCINNWEMTAYKSRQNCQLRDGSEGKRDQAIRSSRNQYQFLATEQNSSQRMRSFPYLAEISSAPQLCLFVVLI